MFLISVSLILAVSACVILPFSFHFYPSVWSPSSLYFLPHLLLVLVLSHLITILITVKSHWSSSSLPLSYSLNHRLSPPPSLILSPPLKLIFQSLPVSFCCFISFFSFFPFCKSNIFGSELSVEPLRVCLCERSVHEQVSRLKLISKRPFTCRYHCHTYTLFCLFHTLLHTQTLM